MMMHSVTMMMMMIVMMITDQGHDAFTDHDDNAFTDCLKCLFLSGFPGSCKHTVSFSNRTPRCSFNSDTPTLKPTNQHAHIV